MAEMKPTLVYTRCVFFRHEDTTILEQQVNHFLASAPLARLVRAETTALQEEVLISLWFEPMPGVPGVERAYDEALLVGTPRGGSIDDVLRDDLDG